MLPPTDSELPVNPVHVLPSEIISRIFCEACALIPYSKEWRREFYPLWLGRICRAWREIAWASSELWATVVIRAYASNWKGWDYRSQADLLKDWLDRANGRKLDIFFTVCDTNHAPSPPHSLMHLLKKFCEKWNRFEVYLPDSWDGLFDSECLSLPNLRTASFFSTNLHNLKRPFPNFTNAPLLQSLGITGYCLGVPREMAWKSFPCTHITHLILDSCTAYVDLNIIWKTLPRLEEAQFIEITIPWPLGRAVHTQLSSLTLDERYRQQIQISRRALYSLTLPALKDLHIHTWDRCADLSAHLLFFRRSACLLRTLTFEATRIDEHVVTKLLRLLPSLEELRIKDIQMRDTGLGSSFFKLLHPDEAVRFLPNLKTFEYSGILRVQTLDFIEPLFLRSRLGDVSQSTRGIEQIAPLELAKITGAERHYGSVDRRMIERSDARYVSQAALMKRAGVLVLIDFEENSWIR